VGFSAIFWYFLPKKNMKNINSNVSNALHSCRGLLGISNHEKYNQIVKEDMDIIVVDKIQNIGIYKQSLDLKIQLEVLGQSLNKLQADNVTLADVFDI
jgi:hypothetical protein